MNDRPLQFFTIVARNYLAYAYVLGDSVKQHHPEADFAIFLMDDVDGTFAREVEARGFRPVLPGEIAIDDYAAFVFKYNVTEASTAVKPFVFRALIDAGAAQVIYLDPDIRCYRRLTEVLTALADFSIVLTPHSVSPPPLNQLPDDFVFLEAGAYNLGFIGVRRGAVAERFLTWWSARLFDWCLMLKEMNLFVDQKWVDLVPAYFDEVLILKSLAYNIAYWNFHERRLLHTAEALKVAQSGEPVAFIHFSGIDATHLDQITKNRFKSYFDLFDYKNKTQLTLSDRPDLVEPFREYAALLEHAGHSRYCTLPYAYAQYENGERIAPLERSLFWALTRKPPMKALPFTVADKSFYQLCRASGLRKSGDAPSAIVPAEIAESADEGRVIRLFGGIIRFLLRVLVRTLGPDVYVKFARYLRNQLQPVYHRFVLKD